MQSNQIKKVKICHGEDIRIFRPVDFHGNFDDLFKQLELFVRGSFNLKRFSLQFIDEENDRVTIQNGADVEDALSTTSKIFIATPKRKVKADAKTDTKTEAVETEQTDEKELAPSSSKKVAKTKRLAAKAERIAARIQKRLDKSKSKSKRCSKPSRRCDDSKTGCPMRKKDVTLLSYLSLLRRMSAEEPLFEAARTWLADSVMIYHDQFSPQGSKGEAGMVFDFLRILKKSFFSYDVLKRDTGVKRVLLCGIDLTRKLVGDEATNTFVRDHRDLLVKLLARKDLRQLLRTFVGPQAQVDDAPCGQIQQLLVELTAGEDANSQGIADLLEKLKTRQCVLELVRGTVIGPCAGRPQNEKQFRHICKDGDHLRCGCGESLRKTAATECYGEHNKWLQCDGCDRHLNVSQEELVWHCPRGHIPAHKVGIDLCQSCYDRKMLRRLSRCGAELLCECRAPLVRKHIRALYDHSGRVSCDGCAQDVHPFAWHCPSDKHASHPNGFDLCEKCYYARMFEDVQQPADPVDAKVEPAPPVAAAPIPPAPVPSAPLEEKPQPVAVVTTTQPAFDRAEAKRDCFQPSRVDERNERNERDNNSPSDEIDQRDGDKEGDAFQYQSELDALKQMGFEADVELMKDYLKNFKGDLTAFIDRLM